jgi:hypothetical protein
METIYCNLTAWRHAFQFSFSPANDTGRNRKPFLLSENNEVYLIYPSSQAAEKQPTETSEKVGRLADFIYRNESMLTANRFIASFLQTAGRLIENC